MVFKRDNWDRTTQSFENIQFKSFDVNLHKCRPGILLDGRFQWAHLLFTEAALIRWRSDFKIDGATRFHEVAGGLNRMTIARWEKIIADSPFRFAEYTLVPIRAAKRWHNHFTRELFTSIIRARLVPR